MSLGDSYGTVAELEIRLGQADDGRYAAALAAASRDAERYCGRQFNNVVIAAARTFQPRNRHVLLVDDFHTTTDLVIETDTGDDGTYETTWTAADYLLWPPGGLRDGVPGWPYERVTAVESLEFPCGNARPSVQVTAQWGWAAVPAAVKDAVLAAAEARLAKQAAPVVGESLDGYSVQFARMGSDSPFYNLNRYRRVVPGLLVA
jgi:hypothetical protein